MSVMRCLDLRAEHDSHLMCRYMEQCGFMHNSLQPHAMQQDIRHILLSQHSLHPVSTNVAGWGSPERVVAALEVQKAGRCLQSAKPDQAHKPPRAREATVRT